MELLYIRINNYKGLSGIDLNFSNRFRFHYDEIELTVKIDETPNFIDHFFGRNISNLTGIIGQNGTGKTSILRYVMQYFGDGNSEIDNKSIAVFFSQNVFYVYSASGISITIPGKQYSIQRVKDLQRFKESTTLIFVSNHFDPTSFYSFDSLKEQFGDTKNLSTNYLLLTDIQKRRTFKDAKKDNLPYRDHANAFSAQEFIRIVKLLRWITSRNERNPFPAKLPPYINLSLYYNEDSPNFKKYIELQEALKLYFQIGRSKRDQFLVNAFEASIFHLADEGALSLTLGAGNFIIETVDRISTYIRAKRDIEDTSTLAKISSIINHLKRGDLWKATSNKLDSIQNFINELNNYLEKKDGSINANETGVSIKLSQATIGSLVNLIDNFYSVNKIGDFAEFYFSHQPLGESSLSSGEYSLLSLFGRINDTKFHRTKRSLLFLIDEAELALHPAWQIRFIDVFTEFISEKFGKREVQILVTSHSPFILSDLPPNCVVLLKRGDSNPVVVDSLDKKNETFGANVHELFTDSFFLQDGLIGEFARRKIENLIKRVHDKNQYTQAEYNSFKKEIDIIGEPYVRFKLLEKVLQGIPREQFDNIIVEREKELDLIRKMRNDKNRS